MFTMKLNASSTLYRSLKLWRSGLIDELDAGKVDICRLTRNVIFTYIGLFVGGLAIAFCTLMMLTALFAMIFGFTDQVDPIVMAVGTLIIVWAVLGGGALMIANRREAKRRALYNEWVTIPWDERPDIDNFMESKRGPSIWSRIKWGAGTRKFLVEWYYAIKGRYCVKIEVIHND